MASFAQLDATLARIARAAQAAAGTRTLARATRPYAVPIETGVYHTGRRAGRVARKAGPARYMAAGRDAVAAQAPAAIGRALLEGPAAVAGALGRLAQTGMAAARTAVPKRSRRLERSIERGRTASRRAGDGR